MESRVTYEMACSKFTYNEKTGELTHISGEGRKIAGGIAGWVRPDGYLSTTLCGRKILVHRIAWLMAKGEWPRGFIDHINGDRSDNRIANLRDVSALENSLNQRKSAGYAKHHQNDSWVVRHLNMYVGTVKTEKEAKKLASFLKDAAQMWISVRSAKEVCHR